MKKQAEEAAMASANALEINKASVEDGEKESMSTGMMFVQTGETPKNSGSKNPNSLASPSNWNPVQHQWFAQAPKNSGAKNPNSLTAPSNWDPVRQQWF